LALTVPDKKHDEKLSRLRVALLALLEQLREVLNVALARAPLVKGNVYEIARRCGTPSAVAYAAGCTATWS